MNAIRIAGIGAWEGLLDLPAASTGLAMQSKWTSRPPAVSGLYLYRQVSAPAVEHRCKVTTYPDGSREIIGDDDDTLDNLSEYEFRGPVFENEQA